MAGPNPPLTVPSAVSPLPSAFVQRRVLLHSHVDEQPFERTGGQVNITPEQPVIVRVHMSPAGYSTLAQQGTVASGFSEVTLPENFASDLETVEPLPENCAF